MSFFPLSDHQQAWKERAVDLAERALAPNAERVDRDRSYPQESLDALKAEGLFGLRVSKEHGGLGEDLLTSCLIIEELAKKCASTAMCYKMHIEASEVISRIATDDQVERFIKPMANGEVFTTVAGSETWTADDNWTSSRAFSPVQKVDGGYQINGSRKSYVTSAGKASHY
ncbi:MAG: acyl-CoA dehydrogenase family protein, partial [SAR202 cluster bacterium]|nr:acyl-CoA dehydrogenase family protein [SAR202 cluster bacterium]